MIKIVQILFFLSNTLANFEAFWITNYEDTKVKSPNLLQPKFKTQSQIDTWDLDIKAQGFFFRNNGWIMENLEGTHCTKMGADSFAEHSYPKCPSIYLPNL